MKIALAQLNPTVGDLDGNVRRILDSCARAARAGARLVVTPELSLVGYPPRDLLLKPRFVADNLAALERLAGQVGPTALVVGYVDRTGRTRGLPLYNAAALLADGRVLARKYKRLLPTYDVFDERRYFEPGDETAVVAWGGLKLGLSICEDIWTQESAGPAARLYDGNPVADLVEAGADVVINMSASPFVMGKFAQRAELVCAQALRHGRPVVYVNQVGGNDELIFDGASFAVNAGGEVLAQLKAFEEDLGFVDLAGGQPAGDLAQLPTDVEALRLALVLGLRDYMRKTGFAKAVVGLSGGVDSSLVAYLAAEAVGSQNVFGIAMPSRYSSAHSVADARALASNLGIRFQMIPIDGPHTAFEEALAEAFAGRGPDVTEENIQARVRGTILMGLSNKFGCLVLATGNKSEVSVGYCTLYGDMVGGLAVIGDVPKTLVYALCRHVNETDARSPIPERVLTKAPSAELRPGQKDEDSLPPYDVLDPILDAYVRDERSYDEIVAAGFDPQTVSRVVRMVDRNEYKRKQAAPVLKVTSRAFGFGRRMPIAQRYEPENSR
ncbi:MAG: NAD synthetase [Planctomycetes bacterium DG_20]|nr:MAG: NAD synthetase [Planctomycetes bacterium DG_20]